MNTLELLRYINATHKTTFELIERYTDGEQGAFAIRDLQGNRYVLKWQPDISSLQHLQDAKTVTDLLRGTGYPAPSYLFVEGMQEGIYSLQSALPGKPLYRLDEAFVPQLFALNALQIGRAVPGLRDWHHEVVTTVLYGGDGYCLHESLQHYSANTRNMLARLQELVVAYKDEPHKKYDIVHGDFQPYNILVARQYVSGVIDWDAVHAGDCVFDLVTLLFYAYDDLRVRKQLWDSIVQRCSQKVLSVYMAHMILRQIDWSLRHHSQEVIERYVRMSESILCDITLYES